MLKNNYLSFWGVILAVFATDFFSKLIVDKRLPLGHKIPVQDGILSFEKAYNTGGAFSILQDHTLLLAMISLITVCVLVWVVHSKKFDLNIWEEISVGLICGGALGNLADRLVVGHVIDFIQLEFINFPIFNFGDIFINIGVIILVISILIGKNEKQKNNV